MNMDTQRVTATNLTPGMLLATDQGEAATLSRPITAWTRVKRVEKGMFIKVTLADTRTLRLMPNKVVTVIAQKETA